MRILLGLALAAVIVAQDRQPAVALVTSDIPNF
jgi:hypothetical protein